MIDQTSALIGKVTELKGIIDQLDGKTIAIDIGGNANAQLDEIANKINALDGKTVVVNVVYRNTGGPDIAPVVQPVIDKVVNPNTTGTLREQVQNVIVTEGVTSAKDAAAAEYMLAMAERMRARTAREAADAETASTRATFDSTAATLASIDATLALARSARLLADVERVVGDEGERGTGVFTRLMGVLAGVGMGAVFAGGAWGILGGTFRGVLGNIGLLHLAFDALLEGLILLVDMAIVVGIALAGMAPAAQDVANHLKAVFTVSEALHQTIPPLTGWFEKLQHQMAPGVVELYGAALNALNNGAFSQMAQTAMAVEHIFETWAAKIDIWLAANGNFGKILQNGTTYLAQFGHFLGEMFIAIDNLLKASPGTIHFLLDFFEAAAKVLDVITSLPTPILMVVIALHSMWIWGNVLLTWAARMLISLVNLIPVMAALATNPLVWVAIAAAALAYFAFQATQASVGAKSFVASINAAVNSLPASQAAVGGITAAISLLNDQIKLTNAGTVLQQWGHGFSGFASTAQMVGDDLQQAFGRTINIFKDFSKGDFLGAAKQGFDEITNFIFHSDSAAAQAQKDIQLYKGAIVSLTAEQAGLFQTAGAVMNTNKVSFVEALGLMDTAGVKASDGFKVAFQMVENLITGYKNLGLQAGLLGSAEAAVTFQTEQQNSKISAVTQAFSNFINMLTGGVNALNTWSVQLQAVYKAAGDAATTLSISNGRATLSIQNLGQAANDAKPYIGGLGANSIALSQAFSQQITNGTAVINNLLTLASAAGMGAQGTNLVAQAGKDMVAELLPMAKGSQLATSLLYGLAQVAGYQGVDSFKALAQWVGNNVDPAKSLNSIVTQLTISASNLTQDVKNLAAAINTNLNTAMAAAIVQADGGQQAFDNAANAVQKAHGQMQSLIPTAQALANTIYNALGGNVNATKNEFITFYQAMGVSKQAANQLWSEIVNNLTPALKNIPTMTRVQILAQASGTGGVTIMGQNISGAGVEQILLRGMGMAQGGKIPGFGGGDHIPALLEPGETVVSKEHSKVLAGVFRAAGVPGYASGGLAGAINAFPGNVSSVVQTDAMTGVASDLKTAITGLVNLAKKNFFNFGNQGGPVSGTALQAAEMASVMASQIGWGGAQWAALNAVAMRESGWSMTAQNPSSGAYGIAQFINGPGEYYQYGGNPYTMVGQITAFFNYIRSRYGTPEGAWAHEVAYGWYDNGGYLMPGLTMAFNGTGRPEKVSSPGGGEATVIHNIIQVDGKTIFESTKPYVYQYNARNSGNGNINGTWRP